MLLESAFHYLFCLKFSFKLVTFSKSYARKQKWVFFSKHSVEVIFFAIFHRLSLFTVAWTNLHVTV